MGFLIQYVADAAPFVYALCGFLALYQLYRTWQVRLERRQAIFSLEREKALNDLYNIFVSAMALLLVMGLTYFISTTLARMVEPVVSETLEPQPDAVALIPTPTHTPQPATATPEATATSAPTTATPETTPDGLGQEVAQVVQPTAVLEPTPTTAAPAVSPALCEDGRARIISPGNGAVVQGLVAMVGTAQHDSFNYYKLEYAPGSNPAGGFAYFDGGDGPVTSGLLGTLNSPSLANGVYTIRLVVVDQTGNYPPPCQVTLTIQN